MAIGVHQEGVCPFNRALVIKAAGWGSTWSPKRTGERNPRKDACFPIAHRHIVYTCLQVWNICGVVVTITTTARRCHLSHNRPPYQAGHSLVFSCEPCLPELIFRIHGWAAVLMVQCWLLPHRPSDAEYLDCDALKDRVRRCAPCSCGASCRQEHCPRPPVSRGEILRSWGCTFAHTHTRTMSLATL